MVTVLGQDSFAQSVRENAADIGLDLTHSAGDPRRAHRHVPVHRRLRRRHGAGGERHGHLRAHHAGVPAPAAGFHQPRRSGGGGDEPAGGVAAMAVPSTVLRPSWPTRCPPSRRPSCCRCWVSCTALKPNRMEAELLSGVPIRDEADIEQAAADALLDTGRASRCIISLSGDGAVRRRPAGTQRAAALPEGTGGQCHRRRRRYGRRRLACVHRPRKAAGRVRADGRRRGRAGRVRRRRRSTPA